MRATYVTLIFRDILAAKSVIFDLLNNPKSLVIVFTNAYRVSQTLMDLPPDI